MYGCGWDYDKLLCPECGCDYEIELKTISYPEEEERSLKLTKVKRTIIQAATGEIEVFTRKAYDIIFLGVEDQEDYDCLTVKQARELAFALNKLADDIEVI